MNLVTGIKSALVPAAIALASVLAPAQQADAATTSVLTHGSACRNYYTLPASDVIGMVDGIRNFATVPRYVVCPAPRTPNASSAGGGFIQVDVTNWPNTRFDCTAYVVDWYSGYVTAAKSFSMLYVSGVTDPNYGWANFSSTEMPYGVHASVLCSVPANGQGILRGIWAVSY